MLIENVCTYLIKCVYMCAAPAAYNILHSLLHFSAFNAYKAVASCVLLQKQNTAQIQFSPV